MENHDFEDFATLRSGWSKIKRMDRSIKAVIFDLDDTLFDHHHSLQAGLVAIQKIYKSLQQSRLEHLENTYTELLESLHSQVLQGLLTHEQARIQRIQRFFLKYGQHLSLAETYSAATIYREAYHIARQPVPGAVALLQYLRTSAGIGVVTNNTSVEQREKLDACGLSRWIDVLVISEEAGVAKPDPAIFEMALAKLNAGPHQTVMVGDSWKIDILGARQAGIIPVWLNRFGAVCPDQTVAMMIDALEPAQTIGDLLLTQ